MNRYTAVFIVGFLGLIDSAYLLYEHVYSGGATCEFDSGLGAAFACDVVTTSQYATFFGVPLALMGVIFYVSVLLSVFLYRYGGSRVARYGFWVVSDIGLLFTLWFLYLQAFVLEAYCLYCLLSAFFVATISYVAIRDFLNYRDSLSKSLSASSANETSFDETPSTS